MIIINNIVVTSIYISNIIYLYIVLIKDNNIFIINIYISMVVINNIIKLSHSDNIIEINIINTPLHIVPE